MIEAEELFNEIGASVYLSEKSQLFGKPCCKINKKAFVCFFQDAMVFKLTGTVHTEALSLPQSVLFDPSGKDRPMKEWVQVHFDHPSNWQQLASDAEKYIGKTQKKIGL